MGDKPCPCCGHDDVAVNLAIKDILEQNETLRAERTTSAAEVERLTADRDAIEHRLDIAEHDSKKAWSALDLIAWHIHKGQAGECGHSELPQMVYDLVGDLAAATAERDAAVARAERAEALAAYVSSDTIIGQLTRIFGSNQRELVELRCLIVALAAAPGKPQGE